ncbi:hypothetical protein [Streptomyces sp. V3I8]|uniref:hypothetical protein n=1 Tax=Streptomyces sp. V3I8 TaxID=3042279 RepID=UPI0027D90C35|nr:hypothetical protein [Streptomyces sp. V3I8]
MLLGGGTGACGTGTGSGTGAAAKEAAPVLTPAEAVAKAAEDSDDITSLHYRITGSVPERGRLTAEAFMRTAPLAMSMKMTTSALRAKGPMKVRYVGRTLYVGGSAIDVVKSGATGVDTEELGDKDWLRLGPATWGRYSVDNNTYKMLPRQIEGSPITQSTLLTGSKNVRKVGAETIHGARTTHYRGTVTGEGMRAARDTAKGKTARERQINSLDQFLGLWLDKSLTMDLWIDEDGRAKRFHLFGDSYKARYSAAGKPLKPTVGEPVDMTVTFLAVNEPVAITAPPAGDTADLGALLGAPAQSG